MSDWSTKIDEATRARLLAMIKDSGVTAKEFMDRLVDTYEVSQVRESLGQVQEMENLHHHLVRIEQIYVGIVKAGQDREEAAATQIKEVNDELVAAKAAVTDAREKADQAAAAASEQVRDANLQIEAARAQAAGIREAADKDVREMEDALARAREAQGQAAKLAALAEEAAAAAKAKCAEMEELARSAAEYRQEAERARGEAVQAKEALARAMEHAAVEKERAVLEVREEGVKTREELAKVREQLAQVTVEKVTLELRATDSGRDWEKAAAVRKETKGQGGSPAGGR